MLFYRDRARFNHGLTSSALFFFFFRPLQSQLDPCWVLLGNSQLFREREACKPCVRSNRLLAELYGGDKREREADWRAPIFRQQDCPDFTLIVKAADASRWLPSLRKSRFPMGGRNVASTKPPSPDIVPPFSILDFCAPISWHFIIGRVTIKLRSSPPPY